LLAHRLSRTPPINKIDASHVPEVLEERLKAARRILDIQLEELADFRKELNRLNDQVLQHMIVIENVKDNYLKWWIAQTKHVHNE
jgi:hypothetical protein